MICPLMSKQYSNLNFDCLQNRCAWYNDKKEECCIKTGMLAAARFADYNAPYKVSLTPATVNPMTGEVSI